MAADRPDFRHLGPAARVAARSAASPRWTVYGLLAGGVLLSWLLLAAAAARGSGGLVAAGPGGDLLLGLPALPLPAPLERLLALCVTPAAAGASLAAFGGLFLMWVLMSVAMMLPAAAPMIRTYCEIADTAGREGRRAVHPLVLVAGYLAVWLAASAAFAALAMAAGAVADSAPRGVALAGSAAALGIAGLYQFSRLKQACLEKCRNPFAILFARWSERASRIFRLGLEQGVWCLGCCWSLMLVMFAVGLMNVFWMALIGLFAIVERQPDTAFVSRAAGAILLVWSAVLLVVSAASG